MVTGTTSASDVLVSTDWVAQHARDAGVRIVEVDVDTTAYGQGHVPGAIGWNWSTELCDTLVRDIIPKAKFEALMSRSGIANDTTVVLYGDNNNWFAAWAFWQMKIYGHRDVRIMNGGRKKWLSDSRDLETATPAVTPTSYQAAAPDSSIRAFLPEVQDALKKGTPLVDVRSPQEFTGEILAPPGLPETCQRGGHIPGAKSIPWGKACNEDGTFKSTAELAATLRRRRRHARQGRHRLLPHRRAIEPHVVRPEAPARLPERQELRRLVDGVGQPGRRAGRKALKASRRAGSGFHTADARVGGLESARGDVSRRRHVLHHRLQRRRRRTVRAR